MTPPLAAPPGAAAGRLRILHSVGHLARGGVEGWLYDVIRRLDSARYQHDVMVWTTEEEAFTAEFRQAGVRVHAVPGHANPWRFAANFRRLLRQAGPFDVLHTHGTQFQGYVLALGRAHGVPVRIAHSHNDIRPALRRAGPLYRAYAAAGHRAIRRFATAGRGVSEAAALSMFGPAWRADPRWKLLHCGIDLRRFAAPPPPGQRAALGIPPGRFVLGHVGRYVAAKNHGFLLDVLAASLTQGVDAHLLLVGDGGLRPGIEQALRQRGLAARATVLADCRDVPGVMVDAMDAFVLPSLHEGLPLVLVEAQAAGLPCLVSEAAAHEAAVHAPLVRRLTLAAGADAWARALTELPARLSPREPLLAQALERSPFSLPHSLAAMAALYEAAVAGSRA